MKREKRIALYKPNGKAVKLFTTLAEARAFCIDHKICNGGWVGRSLESGERFYQPNGDDSLSHNGYKGHGWYVKWVMAKIKENEIEKGFE